MLIGLISASWIRTDSNYQLKWSVSFRGNKLQCVLYIKKYFSFNFSLHNFTSLVTIYAITSDVWSYFAGRMKCGYLFCVLFIWIINDNWVLNCIYWTKKEYAHKSYILWTRLSKIKFMRNKSKPESNIENRKNNAEVNRFYMRIHVNNNNYSCIKYKSYESHIDCDRFQFHMKSDSKN